MKSAILLALSTFAFNSFAAYVVNCESYYVKSLEPYTKETKTFTKELKSIGTIFGKETRSASIKYKTADGKYGLDILASTSDNQTSEGSLNVQVWDLENLVRTVGAGSEEASASLEQFQSPEVYDRAIVVSCKLIKQ